MIAFTLSHWQQQRDQHHAAALSEAVAALDETERCNDEAARMHRENACVELGRAAKAARLARAGEMSTTP